MLTLKLNTLKKTAIALGTAVAMGGVAVSANPAAAGHNPCHPAAVYSSCRAANPCAAQNPCNPCAAKNPCAAENPCYPQSW